MPESINKGLPVHSLYIGSRDGNAFPEADRLAVTEAIAATFDCFTVIDSNGYFQGRNVATLVIKIATGDAAAVEERGRSIGRLLGQQSVGLEITGYYRSIALD